MARSIVTIYGLCVLLAASATANRGFQPALTAPAMHSLRSNASNTHQKRWIAHEFGTGNDDAFLWGKGEVNYYIETESEDEHDQYVRRIEAGMKLWKACGLPDNFKWTLRDASWYFSNRDNCLKVLPNNDGHHETTLGRPPFELFHQTKTGAFMKIDAGEGLPHVPTGWEAGAIFAHEMGHAWGLEHEHQNPKFWSKKYNGGRYDGTIFTDATFDCKGIPGYGNAQSQAVADRKMEDLERMCTEYVIAHKYAGGEDGFTGDQFLPLTNKYTLPSGQGDSDIDWDSIMIYTTHQTNPPVLRKPGGGEIVPKNAPTTRDCDGLKTLYGGGRQGTGTNFLSEPNNARNADFLKIACSD